jgi:hypothetical protein
MVPFRIQGTMAKLLWTTLLMAACALAQLAAPVTSPAQSSSASPAVSPAASPTASSDSGSQPKAAIADPQSPAVTSAPTSEPIGGKVSLVRGVLKRLDPVHDQLLIHPFGGRDIRIAFDARTQVFPADTGARLVSIPAGSVVSVDTVIDHGKLFARSVRTGSSEAVELNGQVVRYDAAKSQLTLRDPMSPQNVSLHVIPSTTVVNLGQPASPQDLSPGMLVRVQFSPAHGVVNSSDNVASNVEILAARGGSFTFQGQVVAIDLRARTVALSDDADQVVRELAIGSLDAASLGLLREGADVNIQAEFDGDRYNVRTVALVPRNP